RLVVLASLASPQTREQGRHFVFTPRRDEAGYRLAHHLLGRVAVEPLGPLVPARDGPLEGLADDRVVRGAHDGGKERLRLVRLLARSGVSDDCRQAGASLGPPQAPSDDSSGALGAV